MVIKSGTGEEVCVKKEEPVMQFIEKLVDTIINVSRHYRLCLRAKESCLLPHNILNHVAYYFTCVVLTKVPRSKTSE